MTRAVLALLLVATVARAEPTTGEAHAGLAVFAEPAPGQSVVVVTPSLDARAELRRWLSASVGWTADVVTGATPRTYGAPDVISSATKFDELRNQLSARVEGRAGPVALAAAYRFGIENDYRSHVLELDARADLFSHNTVLAAAYAHNFDSVCDLDNHGVAPTSRQPLGTHRGCFGGGTGLVDEALSIDGVELSLTQTLHPRWVAQLSGSYQHLDGFQSNPYRQVRLPGGRFAQEAHPTLRDRGALAARARFAVPRTRAALGLELRLYRDTWDVESITVEASYDSLHLGDRLRWRVRARYYQQTRAAFYRDAGEANAYERTGPAGRYFTGDRELAPLADLLIGGLVSWRVPAPAHRRRWKLFHAMEATCRLDLMKVFALTPLPPNQPRTAGVVDAIVASLSALAEF